MPAIYPSLFVLLLISAVQPSGFAQKTGAGETNTTGQLKSVRQFSSAQDVRGPWHPVLNKTLDILAGPKEGEPAPPSTLQEPVALTTDSMHRVLVTDAKGFVHIFDFLHGEYSHLQGGDLRSPSGIATDRQDNVYVSDASLRTVLIYSPKEKFIRYLKKPNGNESYFDTPRGIAVDADSEHIYVCDTARHMIIMLDKKGRVLATFGKRGGGTGPGEFKSPTQVVATGGELFVLDSGNGRVQILDLRGHFRKAITIVDAPRSAGLAVDRDKNIYVSDAELNRLQVFNHDGRLLYSFGQSGPAVEQLEGISGLWVDSGHCLYGIDSKNKRVQLFQIGEKDAGGC